MAQQSGLARLREIFGDQQFLRRSDGLRPTHRALELLPKVEPLINLAYATINAFETFDPATSDRRFRLGATTSSARCSAVR